MMQRSGFRQLALLTLGGVFLAHAVAPPGSSAQSGTPATPAPPAKQSRPHANHRPQHGGLFFMALDNSHHLEGVLDRSNTFRLYLYDAYTRPLKAERVKLAQGTMQIGESESAPEIPLVLGAGGLFLEAALGKDLRLPVKLTLSLRLPGAAPSARPEVFTFPFSHYIGVADSPKASPAPSEHPSEHMNHSM